MKPTHGYKSQRANYSFSLHTASIISHPPLHS